jgi:arabinofuranosyltransferase
MAERANSLLKGLTQWLSGLATRMQCPEAAPQIGLATLLFIVVVVRNAWVVEESYISFRVVDNIIHGYGMRFNTHERVCAVTNPLWTLVMTVVAAVTHDVFFSSILLQVFLSGITAWLLGVRAQSGASGTLAIAALCLSKAFIDWSTSGMENPLGHFLFILLFLQLQNPEPKRTLPRLGWITSITSLCLVHRVDMALLVLPPYLWYAANSCAELRRAAVTRTRILGVILLSSLPFVLWIGFSTLYFGFPLPNTYYAKLNTGIPQIHMLAQGLRYAHYSLLTDPLTICAIAFAMVAGTLARERSRILPFSLGLALASFYVLQVGGDFMGGRFWSLPFLAAIAILSRLRVTTRCWPPVQHVAVASLLGLGLAADFPTLSHQYYALRADDSPAGIADYARGSLGHSSLEHSMDHRVPEHPWVTMGLQAKVQPGVVQVWGALGYAPYHAGPSVIVIDPYALSDGFLARLPIPRPKIASSWRIGHFERALPTGYLESVQLGENRVQDPGLAKMYADLQIIQRSPLVSMERFKAIWRMWTGAHARAVEAYARSVAPKE